ncbi:MAG TPA: PP2C family protein-serine/threonine phosphatase [Candidatus Polarisedimenticolaceae bacterium]|jgi:serine phosphatase RsbU (regulator of sigma subunit)
MPLTTNDAARWEHLADELRNFQEVARFLRPSPGDVPRIEGLDLACLSLPLHDVVGGDHVAWVDFERRYDLEGRIAEAERRGHEEIARNLRRLRRRAGVLVADAAGHRVTDALVAAMLHQAFLLGVNYELDLFGEVTTHLFENLNTRFYQTTAVNKFFTMIYGEISEGGKLRFLSAGHPPPAVFSREFGRFMKISEDRLVALPPVGLQPSVADPDRRRNPPLHGYMRRYQVNEINLLATGDILLLHTDGLSEHADGTFFPARVEPLLADSAGASASEICERLREALYAEGDPVDDVTVVVLKRSS